MEGSRLRTTIANGDAGRPLLLLNGIGSTSDVFEPLREHLDDRTTIGLDAPGVGGSPALGSRPSMRRIADCVAAASEHAVDQPVDVLGVSWGGFLAQELARRHPALVRRLVLVSTSVGCAGLMGPAMVTRLMSPGWSRSRRQLRRIAPLLYGDEIEHRPDLLERQIDLRLARPPSCAGYARQLAVAASWTSLPWLCRLAQPSLVLHGDRDRVLPAANATVLARLIPDARLHVAPGGGHLFHLVRAELTARTIRDFLDA